MSVADRPWVIRDHAGKPICSVLATSREEAIAKFCSPGLRPDSYFGPRRVMGTINVGGWTCKEQIPQ